MRRTSFCGRFWIVVAFPLALALEAAAAEQAPIDLHRSIRPP